jgi:hypothetical protein
MWRRQADTLAALARRELVISARPDLLLERCPRKIIQDRQTTSDLWRESRRRCWPRRLILWLS